MTCDWSKYANFTSKEFNCKHTGKNLMQESFMDRLQALRSEYGKPMVITSGYRDPKHPKESVKPQPGMHSHGQAADIACEGGQAFLIAKLAFKHGFTGIGISQKAGAPRFVHLDTRSGIPVIYSY